MKYDILKPTAPAMPNLGKGTECFKHLLSQASKDMHSPLLPMLFPVLGTKISQAEFQYPSGQWLEMCGQQAALRADSAGNKGQLGLLVEACNRDFRQHDAEELKKYLQYQKTFKKRSQSKERPEEVFPLLRFLPADCSKPGYLKAQMACQEQGGLTTYIDLKEIEQLDNLCGSHKQVTQMLRLMWDREVYNALRATVDGITGSAVLRTNLTVSTTPVRARQFFKYNLFDGTLGRMVFSYKPRGSRDGKIPRIGKFSEEFYQQLDEYLVRLDNCKGRYVIRQLNRLIERVVLNGFGSFKIGLKTKGSLRKEDFSASKNIVGSRLNFCPEWKVTKEGHRIRKFLNDVSVRNIEEIVNGKKQEEEQTPNP